MDETGGFDFSIKNFVEALLCQSTDATGLGEIFSDSFVIYTHERLTEHAEDSRAILARAAVNENFSTIGPFHVKGDGFEDGRDEDLSFQNNLYQTI
mmetsp:Transcript_6154/g.8603  ORF Transcript_6154/g.8603 Transcript_6154/m.8603 type:complete len:96 (+) Transcript_6154:264-551(+)